MRGKKKRVRDSMTENNKIQLKRIIKAETNNSEEAVKLITLWAENKTITYNMYYLLFDFILEEIKD